MNFYKLDPDEETSSFMQKEYINIKKILKDTKAKINELEIQK